MNRQSTANFIRGHEGCRLLSYDDGEGIRTIGWGFNMIKDGARERIEEMSLDYDSVYQGIIPILQAQADLLFEQDLDDAIEDCKLLVSNFSEHPDDVQMVIADMRFNLGATGLSKFKDTIAAWEVKDYCTAAREMKDSKWARQVPSRAAEDIAIVQAHCQP